MVSENLPDDMATDVRRVACLAELDYPPAQRFSINYYATGSLHDQGPAGVAGGAAGRPRTFAPGNRRRAPAGRVAGAGGWPHPAAVAKARRAGGTTVRRPG